MSQCESTSSLQAVIIAAMGDTSSSRSRQLPPLPLPAVSAPAPPPAPVLLPAAGPGHRYTDPAPGMCAAAHRVGFAVQCSREFQVRSTRQPVSSEQAARQQAAEHGGGSSPQACSRDEVQTHRASKAS